jgi:YidC/Oxa1 family membrane protein insertase
MPLPIANVLQPIIDATDAVMVFFHDQLHFSWGFSIIALTIVVRALLLPLTIKQFRSMQALQRLQPEIKKLQAKYKDDKQRLNQEMMKFYQENKVNPLSSCLPIVAQLPIFFSLFYMLRHDLRIDICGQAAKPCGDAAAFLFIPDLTTKATGAVLVVLIILYVGTQLVSSVLMTTTADRQQRILMTALPIVFVPFIIGFPAGLIVYWITTNTWTIAQQAIIRRTVGPMKPLAVPAGAAALTGGGKGSGSSAANGKGDGDADTSVLGRLRARAAAATEPKSDETTAEKPKSGEGKAQKPKAGEGKAGTPARGASKTPPPPPKRKRKRTGRRR